MKSCLSRSAFYTMTWNSLANQGNTVSGQPVTKMSGQKLNWEQPETHFSCTLCMKWSEQIFLICVFFFLFPLISNSEVLSFTLRTEHIPWISYWKIWQSIVVVFCFFLQWAFHTSLMPSFPLQSKWCSEKARMRVITKKKSKTRGVFCKEWKYWHCKCTLEGKSSCFLGGIGDILFTGPQTDTCCQVL